MTGGRRPTSPGDRRGPADVRPYPVNLLVAGRRCLVVGGGPVAAEKVDGLLDAGADVTRRGPRGRRRARRPPAASRVEQRPYAPARRPSYRLVVAATERPGRERRGGRRRRGRRRLGQRGRRPRQLHLHPPGPRAPGRPARHRLHRGRSPGLASWLRERLGGRVRPRIRHAARPAGRGPGRAAGRRTFDPGSSIGSRPSIRECWNWSARADSPKPRSACRRVCRRHRTEPPHRAARPARADDHRRRAPAQGARTTWSAASTSREAVVLSTCNRTEVYAVGRAVPRRLRRHPRLPRPSWPSCPPRTSATTSTSTTTTPPSSTSSPWPPASTPRCSARARSSARSAGAWERAHGEEASRRHAQPAVPPRPRGRQAGPHRDRHRPQHRLGVPGRGGHGRRAPRRPRAVARVLVLGAGEMGEGMVALAGRRRRRPTSSVANRTWDRAVDAGRPGRRPRPSASPTSPRALAEVDLLLTSTGATSLIARARRRRAAWSSPGRRARC